LNTAILQMTAQNSPTTSLPPAVALRSAYVFLAWSAASAVLSALFFIRDSALSLNEWQPKLMETPLGPSIVYGLVVAALLYRLATRNPGHAALHFIGTNAGWVAGYQTAVAIQAGWFAIPLGGLVGAAVTLVAPSLTIGRLRNVKPWAIVCAAGFLAALPFSILFGPGGLSLDEAVSPFVGFLVLFVPWQMLYSASLAYACTRIGN
jgi:hypothetical protein